MTNVDSQRIREIRDNTKAMAEAFSSIASTLAEALELYISTQTETQTETQNSNLTFKTLEYCDICDHKGCDECIANALDEHCIPSQFNKQIEDECAREYEELGLKELKELIEADRKTENSSEKPNNCDTCKHNKLEWYSEVCDGCSKAHSNYEPKDEPQTEGCPSCKYGRNGNITDEERCEQCSFGTTNNYEPIEPQTDCPWK